MAIDINKLTLEEILELKAQLNRIKVGHVQQGGYNMPKHDYASWDWEKSDLEIMSEHGVSRATVSIWRRQLGKQRQGARGRSAKYDFESWDWSKSNAELHEEHGASLPYISQMRQRLGHDKVTKWWPACKEWDWTKSNAQISREHGIDLAHVIKYRKQLGMPPGPRDYVAPPAVARVNIAPPDHSSWDWSRPDVEIARETGLSRERIRQIRIKLGKPKRSVADIKYERFLKLFGHLKETNDKEGRAAGFNHPTFARYCAKAGITRVRSLHKGRKYPWHMVNWEIPNVLLQEIWDCPERQLARWRYNRGLPGAKFRCTKGNYPIPFRHMVEAERARAAEYFKQQGVESAAPVGVEKPTVADDKTAA